MVYSWTEVRGARPSLSPEGDKELIAGGQLKACAHEGER